MASADDVVIQLQAIARNMGLWVQAFNGRFASGSFTMAAAASLAVTAPSVATNSIVMLAPTNAAAATLMAGAASLYVTNTAGTGFTVHTANGAAAAGTETFSYTVLSP